MRKFLILIFLLITLSSFTLKYLYNYNGETVAYHIIMMSLLVVFLLILNSALLLILKKSRISVSLFHALNFFFLAAILIFYLLVLGSNFFWKKTITIKIMKNYFFSLNELINVMPVQKWLLISAPILLTFIICFLYYIARPNFQKLQTTVSNLKYSRKQIALVSIVLLAGAVIFKTQLFERKRKMHFAEEPFLIFTLGSMWQGSGEEMAFDRTRYENGLKDLQCMSAIRKRDDQPDHNFVIILIDGLRADHLSFYGYDRKTTPFLDSLYQDGHLSYVKNSFSTSNNTIGGIAGMFYSKDWDKFGYNGLNIPKFLRKVGYKNYAFLTGFHKEWYGLSALYRNDCDVYYESSMNYEDRFSVDDDFKTLEVIKKADLSTNSFIYIHLLSAHHVGKKYDEFKKFMPDKIGLTVDKREALVNNYDNGVLQSDYIIKGVFSKLASEQLLENSTVFILSDHGELFGEDGKWSHGGDLHEKLLEIPLLVYDQKMKFNNTQAATLLDIAPTIAERIGYPAPACWQGTSLSKEAGNFSVQIYSNDSYSAYPFGTLHKKDSTYTLDIFDKQKKHSVTKEKRDGVWKEAGKAGQNQ